MRREGRLAVACVGDQEVVITRLLARVAELEDLLYRHELHEGRHPDEGLAFQISLLCGCVWGASLQGLHLLPCSHLALCNLSMCCHVQAAWGASFPKYPASCKHRRQT